MIALAHHWLVQMRGGERVLEQFCQLFPTADIYCLVATNRNLSPALRPHKLRPSYLNVLPGAVRYYKQLLPLHPLALCTLRVKRDTRLILVSDASMIKALSVGKQTTLVCYCHSPPRYLWEMKESYKQQSSGLSSLGKLVFDMTVPYCRRFDYRAAQRVDYFIANSEFVQARIRKYYGKESVVINPPVEVESFAWQRPREDFCLVVSELVPYKRIDIAVEAFNRSGRRLVIIGDGSERKRLQQIAQPNVEFLGRQPFEVLKQHYETCRAFIFPGIEDFGITPVEAQAAGSPVVAFSQGGALETIVDGKTGVFFHEQTAEALQACLQKHAQSLSEIRADDCRANAEHYRPEIFRDKMTQFLKQVADQHGLTLP